MLHNPPSSFGPRPPRPGLFASRGAQAALRPRYIHVEADRPSARWPRGVGLTIAAFFSLAIWAALIFAVASMFNG